MTHYGNLYCEKHDVTFNPIDCCMLCKQEATKTPHHEPSAAEHEPQDQEEEKARGGDSPCFSVWCAGSKTGKMFFEDKEDAEKFYASLGATGGYTFVEIYVFKKGQAI